MRFCKHFLCGGPLEQARAEAAGDQRSPLRRVLPSPRTGKVALQGPDEVPAERITRVREPADVPCRRGAGGASPTPTARTERRRGSRAIRESPLRRPDRRFPVSAGDRRSPLRRTASLSSIKPQLFSTSSSILGALVMTSAPSLRRIITSSMRTPNLPGM